jgi:hypothetical protein
MKCPEDCPLLTECKIKDGSTLSRITDMMVELEKIKGLVETNRKTSEDLAKLPESDDVVEARGFLEQAVVLADQARGVTEQSIQAFEEAINANQTYAQAVLDECHGEPYYIDDPVNPGDTILKCASPGVYEP